MAKKRYALVGTGGRAEFFYGALAGEYRDTCELVAFATSTRRGWIMPTGCSRRNTNTIRFRLT